jgi:hypothetical protein
MDSIIADDRPLTANDRWTCAQRAFILPTPDPQEDRDENAAGGQHHDIDDSPQEEGQRSERQRRQDSSREAAERAGIPVTFVSLARTTRLRITCANRPVRAGSEQSSCRPVLLSRSPRATTKEAVARQA